MLKIVIAVIFCWLFIKAVGLAFRVAWGVIRIAASILLAVAVPLLILGLIFVGGAALLVPVVMLAVAIGLLKACI